MFGSLKSALVMGVASIAVFAAPKASAQTIVDIAANNPDFSTLVAAVKAAGLVDALSGDGPFTVFAPTNEAFAKIPANKLNELLKPENRDKLKAILTYHVVPGKVMAADVAKLKNGTKVQTLNGASIVVKTKPKVKVDQANVTATDIVATNGVIHVIDTVITPAPPKAGKVAGCGNSCAKSCDKAGK